MKFGKRLSYAFRCFFSVLSDGRIPEEIESELIAAPAPAAAPAPVAEFTAPQPEKPAVEPADRAIQMLALLQRDGRLIDFFTEDIASYQDAQIGAAVRDVHENCRRALANYLRLEPIIAEQEGRPVTIESGFDPAEIKLIGNVTGKPPLRGQLRHGGWRVSEVHLPPLPAGNGRSVIAPAEVEVM